MKVYLCGPINGCTDEEAKDWRELVKAAIGAEHCIDPMVRDYRGREAECVNEIVELDKIDILQSNIILVNYDKPSVGTAMEVIYAWMHHKIILVVYKEGTVISPWLRYHSTEFFHSFEKAIDRIVGLQLGA